MCRVRNTPPLPETKLSPPWNMFAEPNLFYLNDGEGKFTPTTDSMRAFTTPHEISRALCVGDIDLDGDLDMLITNIQGPARLYRNDAPRKGNWLMVRAIDPRYHRDAIGARITVVYNQTQRTQTIRSAYSYLTAVEPIAHFGLGSATSIDRIQENSIG